MGVGHVPTGSLCEKCQGHDLPRCQHRGTRAVFGSLETSDARQKALGILGERIAADFLSARGAVIVARNERIGRGELDLIADIDGTRVAVEVKTGTGESDPVYHFDDDKTAQVRSLAGQCHIARVDYIGVSVSDSGVLVRWLPAAG